MRISEAFPTKFISAADLQGRTARVKISRVEIDKVGEDTKPIVYFEGKQKGLALNKTNANNIAAAYGDETNDWIGGEVELYEAMVDYQGKTVPAVRVRIPPRRPASQKAQSAVERSVQHPFPGDQPGPHDDEIGF